jgi:hypothetical protein
MIRRTTKHIKESLLFLVIVLDPRISKFENCHFTVTAAKENKFCDPLEDKIVYII